MDVTREIYWNVGQGGVALMYLLAVAAVSGMVAGFVHRFGIWRQGRPVDRFDSFGKRLRMFLFTTFTQVKVLRVRDGGTLHAGFFWAFLLLFSGSLLLMLQVDLLAPLFRLNLLSGAFYRIFSLVLDMAGVAALVMLAGLFVRRFIVRPKGLETARDDLVIHALLFTILVSGFMVEGARMAATELKQNPALALWSPAGLGCAWLFASTDVATLHALHSFFWWGHLLLALCFIAIIPVTRLRHIFTTSGGNFLIPLEPKGTIDTIRMDDERIEQFGVSMVADLTWKELFDADACTFCKRCQDRCPAYSTGKPLSPMKMLSQIGHIAESHPDARLVDTVSRDALWACTTCGACEDICPAGIEHVNKIIGMRRSLALMDGEFPGDEVRRATDNIELNGNPFGMAYATRGAWAAGLPKGIMAEKGTVDILYFAGCYASFDSRNRNVAESFLRICAAAGVKAGILGPEESCCGEPLRKLGNEYLYQIMAARNIETIRSYGVRRIVTTCPHCFSTLGRDYRDLGLDLPVEHYTTFISRLIAQKKLKLKPVPFSCTCHDSCYLGRYGDIFEEPRSILRAIGGQLAEMPCSGYDSFCCGAGGGRILAEEKTGQRINMARVRMAKASGMPMLVSNCPFCLSMFEDGIRSCGFEGLLQARDLAELVAERLENTNG